MNYSGNAEFDYEIERMKNKESGEFVMIDSVQDEDPAYEYVCLNLKVTGNSYFVQGKTSGLPENCYPDEGSTEITEVLLNGKDVEDMLTGKEKEAIIEKIAEMSAESNDFAEPDEDYDDDYDAFDDGGYSDRYGDT